MTAAVGLPWRVERRLGEGAFAEVLLVEGAAGPLACKLARPQPAAVVDEVSPSSEEGAFWAKAIELGTASATPWDADPNAVLEAESRTLARIRHPAFVRLESWGKTHIDGAERVWLLLEWIDGQSWRGCMGTRVRVAQVVELARGIAEVQQRGELDFHGDLKPENLMLDRDGRVRVIDPASGALERDAKGTVRRMLVTDWYSPWRTPSDLPAIGMLAIEAATGQHALVDRKGSSSPPARTLGPALTTYLARASRTGTEQMAERITRMPMPRELAPSLPHGLEQAALRCLGLSWDGQRLEMMEPYGSVAEAAADLARYA
jgi:serine/threonine protein kinase